MIYQVYYEEEQRRILDPRFRPYNNTGKLTFYFENYIIKDMISSADNTGNYFGVLSYNFKHKIEQMKYMRPPFTNLSSESYKATWLSSMIEKNTDVIFLMEHKSHDPVVTASEIHPNFEKHWNAILLELGLEKKPGNWDRVIYCNYFIAKQNIYKKYVDELLIPAMDVMDRMPILTEDAHYPRPIQKNVQSQLGLMHYPYHPFICERLFSYWYNFMYQRRGTSASPSQARSPAPWLQRG